MARLLGLFSSDRLASEISAVTRVIVILQRQKCWHAQQYETYNTLQSIISCRQNSFKKSHH